MSAWYTCVERKNIYREKWVDVWETLNWSIKDFFETLLILLGELLVSGELMGWLRGFFCPSTCHRPHCMEIFQVGEFLFCALWNLPRGGWFRCPNVWQGSIFHCQGLILGPLLTPVGRGRSKHPSGAWGPAPVPAGPQETQHLLTMTSLGPQRKFWSLQTWDRILALFWGKVLNTCLGFFFSICRVGLL